MRWRVGALAVAPALALAGTGAHAQAAPAYTAGRLHCARFAESSRSHIVTETAGRARRAFAERDGILTFRARDTAGGIALEAWYDSLAVRHGPADSLVSPDTDGLIGGRYRGLLGPGGEYQRLAAPFVPAQVAEAFDAASALDDLFPRLPPDPLAPGSSWTDGEGLEIERLADSVASGAPLRRYTVRRRAEQFEAVPQGDTVPVPLRQTSAAETRVVWHPDAGLLRSSGETEIEVSIPAGGRVRAPIRSRIEQRFALVRLPPAGSCS